MRPASWLCLCLLAAGGCAEPEYVEPPPPTVTVAKPVSRAVTDYLDITGTVQAIETVEIRARVEGFLESIDFLEGDDVEKGTLLYQIDPDEYEARVDRAKAALATAHASLSLASATLESREEAAKTGAVSRNEVLENRAQRDVAIARVQSSSAELRRAELDLGYTQIHAPITGRVGHNEVDPGNLVGAVGKTLLTTMVRYDPIQVYFSISERDLLRLAAAMDRELPEDERVNLVDGHPIEIGRAMDEGYPFSGELDFADSGVDQDTGTLMLRAEFPNPEPIELFPGLFVRGRIPLREREGVLLVPERALGGDQSGRYLLVVGDDDVVEYRSVQVGALEKGMRAIEKGISANDRVVVNGVLFARPGAKVSPETEVAAAKAPAS